MSIITSYRVVNLRNPDNVVCRCVFLRKIWGIQTFKSESCISKFFQYLFLDYMFNHTTNLIGLKYCYQLKGFLPITFKSIKCQCYGISYILHLIAFIYQGPWEQKITHTCMSKRHWNVTASKIFSNGIFSLGCD